MTVEHRRADHGKWRWEPNAEGIIRHLAIRKDPVLEHRFGPRPGQSPIWRYTTMWIVFRMPRRTNGVALGDNRPEFPCPILRAYCWPWRYHIYYGETPHACRTR